MNRELALNEFNPITNGTLSVEQVKNWLSTYQELYSQSNKIFSLFEHTKTDDQLIEELFVQCFDAFSELIQTHQYETQCRKALASYNKIKTNSDKLKEWLALNEKLGATHLISFMADYLDYSEEPYHLSIFILNFKKVNIYIKREAFHNIINFLEIFDELYWVKEMLPENITRLLREL